MKKHHTRWETIVEWYQCIISPEHAKTTWIRVTWEQELRYYLILKFIVRILFLLAVIFGLIALARWYPYLHYRGWL